MGTELSENVIVSLERLKDDLLILAKELKKRYARANLQVTSASIRKDAAKLAESWFVEFWPVVSHSSAASVDHVGDLNVHFQRLLTYSEHASLRSRYDAEIKSITKDFKLRLVIPLRQDLQVKRIPLVRKDQEEIKNTVKQGRISGQSPILSVFVGMSFADNDRELNYSFIGCLEALGLVVETGEKPRADNISDKVKRLIDKHSVFVGIFACRDKIEKKSIWTTSTWVIEEKAYAIGKRKRVILLREKGVETIGGLQGDYEYVDFTRQELHKALIKLIEFFEVEVTAIKK